MVESYRSYLYYIFDKSFRFPLFFQKFLIFLKISNRIERIPLVLQQRKNFSQTKRNEPCTVQNSFSNLIFFCLNFGVHFKSTAYSFIILLFCFFYRVDKPYNILQVAGNDNFSRLPVAYFNQSL